MDQFVCDGKTLRCSAIETEDGNHRFVAQVTVYARAIGVALAQKAYDTSESSERAALQELLASLDLEGFITQAEALHTTRSFFGSASPRGPRSSSRSRPTSAPCHRQIPFTATDHERRHGRDMTCIPQPIDQVLFDRVAAEARESPRRRRNHNLHAEPDLVQRFINVLQPGTYVRPPHRLDASGPLRGLELAEGQVHTLVALTHDAVMFEIKQGPYEPAAVQGRAWRVLFVTPSGAAPSNP